MSDYTVVRHQSAREFLDRAQEWLVQREVENNLILSIAAQLLKAPKDDAYLVTIEKDGEVAGAAFRTPPHRLSVTTMPPDATDAFVTHVMQAFDHTPGVIGPEETAKAVAKGIAAKSGGRAEEGRKSRIYELRKVTPPAMPPGGKLRLATPADSELLEQWLEEFSRETGHSPGGVSTYTRSHIANKTMFLWDDDGPKTTALYAGVMPHGVRVGFVFTPAEYRGRGYASAITAAASQRALDSGNQFCCLYTDLENPTSNAIYQKVGYTPVRDMVDYIIS